ncbi:MAG: NAD(P)H-binding protein [Actinomycetia bacterium]|nr:NAD(P)H-binding protein [Actinomycetes bacterium]
MTNSPIIILGGAGKTGRRIATRLDARGVDYRLASRSSQRRFDWYDETTWRAAVRGSDTAYVAPPVDPAGCDAAARFVKQATADGLRRVVLLSGRGVGGPDRDFAAYDGQLAVERAVRDSGVDATIVQPAWFMQNFSQDFLYDYVLAGQLRVSTGAGAEAWVDTNDVGDVMTEALLDERHVGQTYVLSGPRLLTMSDIAAELTAATRRSIEYVDLDPDEHVEELLGYGVPRADAEALRDLFTVIRKHRSEYLSDGIQQVLGREPRDFADWARKAVVDGSWSG